MSVVVNTNVFSMNAQRNLSRSQVDLQTSMSRLSSGLRINSGKDDAAGLAVATRMDSQGRGLNVAERNANDAISLLQTADSAVGSITDITQRMRELSVQAANGTYSNDDRALMNTEYTELKSEIERIAEQTSFNGKKIIGASAGGNDFQVGANAGEKLTVTTKTLVGKGSTLGSIATASGANAEISAIDGLLKNLNTDRATYGAGLNRLQNTVSNLQVAAENQFGARSRIMDTDFAAESAKMTRANILQQAGSATLSQANAVPQLALSLLG